MYIQYILYYIEHTFENYYFYVSIFFLLSTTTFVAQLFVIYNRDVPSVTKSVPDSLLFFRQDNIKQNCNHCRRNNS